MKTFVQFVSKFSLTALATVQEQETLDKCRRIAKLLDISPDDVTCKWHYARGNIPHSSYGF